MHNSLDVNPPGAFTDPGPEGWVRFLDELGLDAAVLYPTAGLAFGKMIDVDLAVGTARAYNDWLYDSYLKRDQRLKGIALIPLQDPDAAVAELRRAVYVEGRKVLSYDYLKELTPLSLALWYMDDAGFTVRAKGLQERTREGSGRVDICVEAFEEATRHRLVSYLADTWGIRAQLITRGARKVAILQFPMDETRKLQELIAPYVHPSMDYKLLPRLRGLFGVEPVFVPPRYELLPLPIKAISPKPLTRSTHRFDIEVEGSHNYFVDGVMVHNSPETTPGGRALKFYASVRLDIRKIENIKNGQEVTGSRVRVKVVKSKVSAPFRQAEFDIQYGHGISKEGSLLDTAAERGIVVKSGSWYLYDGDQIGQGRENAKAFLSEHPDMCVEIATKVKLAVGLGPVGEGEDEGEEKAPVFTVVP